MIQEARKHTLILSCTIFSTTVIFETSRLPCLNRTLQGIILRVTRGLLSSFTVFGNLQTEYGREKFRIRALIVTRFCSGSRRNNLDRHDGTDGRDRA